jgi:hypothetical protein
MRTRRQPLRRNRTNDHTDHIAIDHLRDIRRGRCGYSIGTCVQTYSPPVDSVKKQLPSKRRRAHNRSLTGVSAKISSRGQKPGEELLIGP